jgi:hypothetical protein
VPGLPRVGRPGSRAVSQDDDPLEHFIGPPGGGVGRRRTAGTRSPSAPCRRQLGGCRLLEHAAGRQSSRGTCSSVSPHDRRERLERRPEHHAQESAPHRPVPPPPPCALPATAPHAAVVVPHGPVDLSATASSTSGWRCARQEGARGWAASTGEGRPMARHPPGVRPGAQARMSPTPPLAEWGARAGTIYGILSAQEWPGGAGTPRAVTPRRETP